MPKILNDMTDLLLHRSMMPSKPQAKDANSDPEAMKAACKDFESLFVNIMMKEMRDTVPQNEIFGGGAAEKLYTSMLDAEVAKHVSKHRGIGLANLLYDQMSHKFPKKE